MALFETAHRLMGGGGGGGRGGKKLPPLPNICHTYPAITKHGTVIPYLKKIQKFVNRVTHPLSSADIAFFHWKYAGFVISRNTDIDCILIHNF